MKSFLRFSILISLAYLAMNISVHAQITVSNTLAAVNIERGLFLKGLEGGATTVVTKGGLTGRSTIPPAGMTGGFMYFATDPACVDKGSTNTLFVTVEYFDEGFDQFRIEYDAQKDPENIDPDRDPFTPAQNGAAIAKYDTKKWVTYQFRLTDVYFGKRQFNVADFRINDLATDANGNPVEGEAPELIGKVVVSKAEPIPLHIKYATTPVVLDGKLDDVAWATASPFFVNSAAQDVIRPSKWTGTNDYSLTARFAWDNNYLYLAYDVTDDVPRVSLDDPTQAWNGDGAEVYFGFDQSKPGRTAYLPNTDFQIAISTGQNPVWEVLQGGITIFLPADDSPFAPKKHLVVVDRPGGYIFEARVPWAMLTGKSGKTNAPPIPGQLVGFNVFANDGDNPDRPAQEKAMGFTGRPQAYTNPSAWATVQMDAAPVVEKPILKATRDADGKFRLSWPTSVTGFKLQQTEKLGGTWSALTDRVLTEGNAQYVIITPAASAGYYRLIQ